MNALIHTISSFLFLETPAHLSSHYTTLYRKYKKSLKENSAKSHGKATKAGPSPTSEKLQMSRILSSLRMQANDIAYRRIKTHSPVISFIRL